MNEKERNKEVKSSGDEDDSNQNDASTTCDIIVLVANYVDDVTPPHELPREDQLLQFFDALKNCHTAALGFEWNNLSLGHNGKPH
eukprot:11219909-Ditylum_brightwellii.AAC.1